MFLRGWGWMLRTYHHCWELGPFVRRYRLNPMRDGSVKMTENGNEIRGGSKHVETP